MVPDGAKWHKEDDDVQSAARRLTAESVGYSSRGCYPTLASSSSEAVYTAPQEPYLSCKQLLEIESASTACGTQDSLPLTSWDKTLDSLPDEISRASDSEADHSEVDTCESSAWSSDTGEDHVQSRTARKEKWLQRREMRKARAQARKGITYAELLKNQFRQQSVKMPVVSPVPGCEIKFDAFPQVPEKCGDQGCIVPRLVPPGERLCTIHSNSEASNSDVESRLTVGSEDQISPGVNTRDSLPSLPPISDGSEASESDSESEQESDHSIKSDGEACADTMTCQSKLTSENVAGLAAASGGQLQLNTSPDSGWTMSQHDIKACTDDR